MIYGFIGQMGDGKTLGGVKELYKWFLRGRKIYSNIWLAVPHVKLELEDLFDIVEGKKLLEGDPLVFIDEIHMWLDSRVSSSKRNRIMSYFLSQTRKMSYKNGDVDYGLILIYTTQFIDLIDKRLRHFTSGIVECQKIDLGLRKVFSETLTVIKGKHSRTYEPRYYFGEPYYFLFNTQEIVKMAKTRYDKGEL